MKETARATASQGADCGHRSRHLVRIYAPLGWTNVCLRCWRQQRSYYRSLDQYSPERARLAAEACDASDEVAV